MPDLVILEAAVLGALIGAIVLVGGVFWSSSAPPPVRVAMVLTCAAAVAHFLSRGPLRELVANQSPTLADGVFVLGASVSGLFWAFAMAVFLDRPASRLRYAPAIALMTLQLFILASPEPWRTAGFLIINLSITALSGHILFLTLHGWNDDLVEGRRRLRRPLLTIFAVCAALGLVLAVHASLQYAGVRADWTRALIDLALALLLVPCILLIKDRDLFSALEGASATAALKPQDDQALARLLAVMDDAQVWREPDLKIAQLAALVGEPEHRLRRLINGRLGHQNFSAFVNGYRIAEAKRMLAAPSAKDRTIAEIAFDVGFGSLGPFNRAFKLAAGQTPTAWRGSPESAVESQFDESEPGRPAVRRI